MLVQQHYVIYLCISVISFACTQLYAETQNKLNLFAYIDCCFKYPFFLTALTSMKKVTSNVLLVPLLLHLLFLSFSLYPLLLSCKLPVLKCIIKVPTAVFPEIIEGNEVASSLTDTWIVILIDRGSKCTTVWRNFSKSVGRVQWCSESRCWEIDHFYVDVHSTV